MCQFLKLSSLDEAIPTVAALSHKQLRRTLDARCVRRLLLLLAVSRFALGSLLTSGVGVEKVDTNLLILMKSVWQFGVFRSIV